MSNWMSSSLPELAYVALSAVGIFVAVVTSTRILGLRSFSKMSSFDFAMTVAIGSLAASTLLTPTPSLAEGVVGLAALYLMQWAIARARLADLGSRILDNSPILLMDGPRMLKRNMRDALVTEEDLRAKLREANVVRLSQVRAVVLETTGDVSVLHATESGPELEGSLLKGVRREP
jgi:uncharacterized membrane protein YcaP (DUF421 family)